jgi:dihydroxyacid dehydratase/phosphogluconate dehydratase
MRWRLEGNRELHRTIGRYMHDDGDCLHDGLHCRGLRVNAVVAEHSRLAVATGRLAVELAWKNRTPLSILTRESFENAMVTQLAISGSTNAIVHMIAMAGRAGIKITLDDYDRISRRVPVLADVRPSGKFLMEDFHHAGGLRGMLARLQDQLHLGCETINGGTFGDQLSGAEVIDNSVIRTRENPLWETGGTCVLRGNLSPNGCVLKTVAADPKLQQHIGPALVFDSYAELKEKINAPDLDVDENTVLVLRSAGPIGAPGFPEWGMLPIPNKLLKAGVRDMVRISDARMSGTSYGTCILHVSPESYLGGPLALVENGDRIQLDVSSRSINLLVDEDTLKARREKWVQPTVRWNRGYHRIFSEHVTQAHEGCDFDFLHGNSPNQEPDIF